MTSASQLAAVIFIMSAYMHCVTMTNLYHTLCMGARIQFFRILASEAQTMLSPVQKIIFLKQKYLFCSVNCLKHIKKFWGGDFFNSS